MLRIRVGFPISRTSSDRGNEGRESRILEDFDVFPEKLLKSLKPKNHSRQVKFWNRLLFVYFVDQQNLLPVI
jgi:hypothetical protein